MDKYKIVYTDGESSDERDLLSLLDNWCCTDGLGGCKYFRNKEEITLKEFTEDFYKAIDKQAGKKKDDKIMASSGDYAKVASSGDSAQVASSGDYTKVASSGYYAQVASSGYYAKVASSGDYAKHDIKGKDSVCFDCGIGGVVKGVKGTFIALCEWYYENKKWQIRATVTAQIDGKKLKENTYYGLYDGKITEIDFSDDIKTAVIETKGKVKKVKFINKDTNTITNETSYIVSDGNGNFAHGKTIKDAKKSLLYKISNRDTSQYKDLTLDSKLTFSEAIKMYRVITGACESGTKFFIEQNKLKDRKYTVREMIELTKGQYGNETLQKFFDKGAIE